MVKLGSLTRGTTVKGILPNSSATGIGAYPTNLGNQI
jgi:hypothetical protein